MTLMGVLTFLGTMLVWLSCLGMLWIYLELQIRGKFPWEK